MEKKVFLVICVFVVLQAYKLSGQDLTQPTQESIEKSTCILFLGNSLSYHNFGVYYHIKKLAESVDPPIDMLEEHIVYSGITLAGLWTRDKSKALNEIQSGKYGVVVLQEDLPETTVAAFRDYCSLFVTEIKKNDSRAILFMAWEYPRLHWISTEGIAREHYALAKELDIEVSPVALAWQESLKERPDVKLYSWDKEHPTAAGTYLSACMLFATIFKICPIGLPYYDDVTPEQAIYLQEIAWTNYKRQANR